MAIALTGIGGFWVRFGKEWYGGIDSSNLFLGTGDINAGGLRSAGVCVTNILAQYQSALQDVVDGITGNLATLRKALDGWKSMFITIIKNTLIRMADADVVLTIKDDAHAVAEIIRQMANGNIFAPTDMLKANTVSASVASDSLYTNNGNGALAASVVRPDGRNNEYVLAETIDFVCTGDSASGATARQEQFAYAGDNNIADVLEWDYPVGSGCSGQVTSVDAAQNNSGGNILYNSSFSAYTNGGGSGNQPDYWGAAVVGVYGTDININTSGTYRTGVNCLKFTGTGGAVLSSIMQKANVASPAVAVSGTNYAFKPSTVYAVNFYAKDSGAGLLAGVVAVSLMDQGTPSVVTDDAGTACTVSVAFSTTTASFAAVTGYFRTPKVLPTTGLQVALRVTTALTSGESIYIADLAIKECASPLYTGGPYGAIFSGATNWAMGDRKKITVANNYGGLLQTRCMKTWDMRGMGLQFPSVSDASETIADSLLI